MDKLKTIESSIQFLEGKLLVDEDFMEEDDLQNLRTTINGLKCMLKEEQSHERLD